MSARGPLPAPWQHVGIGRYAHPAGYTVEYAPRPPWPSAIWRYVLYGPGGAMILSASGRTWPTLKRAAAEVERRLAAVA